MSLQPKVTLIIPVLNGEKTIVPILQVAKIWERENPTARQVVVIDDGSKDATPKIAEQMNAKILHPDRNSNTTLGKVPTFMTGLLASRRNNSDILLIIPANIDGLKIEHLQEMTNSLTLFDKDMVTAMISAEGEDFRFENESLLRAIRVKALNSLKYSPWVADPVKRANKFIKENGSNLNSLLNATVENSTFIPLVFRKVSKGASPKTKEYFPDYTHPEEKKPSVFKLPKRPKTMH